MAVRGSRYRVLPIEQLEGLRRHKYASEGRSLVDTWLQGFWNHLVSLTPMWVAPNLITWSGLIINVVTNLILLWYNPGMKQGVEVPTWAYLATTVGLFIYQTLDNMDGKQARRTGSATPLGELFDHGCDAVSTVVVIVGLLVALQLESSYLGFASAVTSFAIYYTSHWECYVKGRLKFNTIDVTEAQYLIMLAHLTTAYFGENVWNFTLVGNFDLRAAFLYPMVAFTWGRFYSFLVSILEGGPGPDGSTIAETSVLSPLLPLLAMLMGLNHMQSYSFYEEWSGIFIVGVGCAVAKLTCKLIVAHMSESAIDQFDYAHVVPIVFVLTEFTGLDDTTRMLLCCCFWILDLTHYAISVVHDMCIHLNISCFTIEPKSTSE